MENTCCSCKLSTAALCLQAVSAELGEPMTVEQVTAAMIRMDVDGDGKVTRAAGTCHAQSRNRRRPFDRLVCVAQVTLEEFTNFWEGDRISLLSGETGARFLILIWSGVGLRA